MSGRRVIVHRPLRGSSHGLLLLPRSPGLLVVGFCPSAAGALARRSGVLAGDAVVAAETEVGERAEAVTHGEGALRGAMTQALAKVELLRCGGVDVGMDVDALEQGEQQTIRALIAAHEQVERRLSVLKAHVRGNQKAGIEELARVYAQIQECEGTLEVLELVACNIPGMDVSPTVERLRQQAREQSSELEPDAPQMAMEQAGNSGQVDTLAGTLGAPMQLQTQTQTESQEQRQQEMELQTDAVENGFGLEPYSPPPEEFEDDAGKRREEETSTHNQQSADRAAQEITNAAGAKREPVTNSTPAATTTESHVKAEKNHQSARGAAEVQAVKAIKSGRREGEQAAEAPAAKRVKVLDLTGDDEDVVVRYEGESSQAHNNSTEVTGAPIEEPSVDSIDHLRGPDVAPHPPVSVTDEVETHATPSNSTTATASNSGCVVSSVAAETAEQLGEWDVPADVVDADDAATVIEADVTTGRVVPNTESQRTEFSYLETQDTLPPGDEDYEPSQPIDADLLSQSPRTTRSSVGLTQESVPSQEHRPVQVEELDNGPIEDEAAYFHRFRCTHPEPCQYCGELAAAMLKHCLNDVGDATKEMAELENRPLDLSQAQLRYFREAFFQYGEDFEKIQMHLNRLKGADFSIESVIGYFYKSFKPSRAYKSAVKERKLCNKQ